MHLTSKSLLITENIIPLKYQMNTHTNTHTDIHSHVCIFLLYISIYWVGTKVCTVFFFKLISKTAYLDICVIPSICALLFHYFLPCLRQLHHESFSVINWYKNFLQVSKKLKLPSREFWEIEMLESVSARPSYTNFYCDCK